MVFFMYYTHTMDNFGIDTNSKCANPNQKLDQFITVKLVQVYKS